MNVLFDIALRCSVRPALRPLSFIFCACLCSGAAAFPDKPVHLVVPYTAGGTSDIVARVLSAPLAEAWAQPVRIDDLPGGATVFGTETVAKAAADGHTLLAGTAALAINEALSRKLPYHALRDFAPISLVARQHIALAVLASSSFATAGQLRDAARARPGRMSYGSSGPGTVGHLAGELFKLMTESDLNHVAYNGTRQAISELISQHVSCALVPLSAVMPYVKSGRVRVIGLTGARRAAVLPNVPTIGETLPGYEVDSWIGILAPYGASVQLVRRINADLSGIINRREIRERLTSLGYEPVASTPGEFQERLAADIERYSRIVFDVGIVTH